MKIKSKRHADNKVEPKEDRKVFHVDVGNILREDVKRYLEEIKERMGMRMTYANPRMYLGDDVPVAVPSLKHIEMQVDTSRVFKPLSLEDFRPMELDPVEMMHEFEIEQTRQRVLNAMHDDALVVYRLTRPAVLDDAKIQYVSSEKPDIIDNYTPLTYVGSDVPVTSTLKFKTRYD